MNEAVVKATSRLFFRARTPAADVSRPSGHLPPPARSTSRSGTFLPRMRLYEVSAAVTRLLPIGHLVPVLPPPYKRCNLRARETALRLGIERFLIDSVEVLRNGVNKDIASSSRLFENLTSNNIDFFSIIFIFLRIAIAF